MRDGVAPIDGVAQLKERLLVLKLGDRSTLGKSTTLLAEIHRRELKPSLIIARRLLQRLLPAKTCSDGEGTEKAPDLRRKHRLRRRE